MTMYTLLYTVCLQTVALLQYKLLTCWENPQKNWYRNWGKMKHTFWKDLRGEKRQQMEKVMSLWQVHVKRFEESKNATIYTFLFMQRLCAISSLSGPQRAGLPKGKKKMNQLAGHCLLWKPPTLIIVAMNPGENVAPGIHESSNLSE